MELTRRSLLAGAAGAAAWTAVPGWARKREPAIRGGTFGSGVIAGFPGQRSVRLWTRIEGVEASGRLTVQVARDPGFARLVHHGGARCSARRDFTVHANVDGLAPGEDYWYRFVTRDGGSTAGHFRTRPPADSQRPVRIAFFSCQGWEAGYYTAHAGLAAEPDIDLVVSLGDYIYEETDDVGPRRDTTGANRDGNAQTLAEYRQKYRLYRSDVDLRAMHAAHGFACVPDDHDLESGYSAREPGETQGFERRVPFAERKRAALLAMNEHMPLLPRIDGADRLYRAIRWGRHADVLLTDLHRYADPYPCRDGAKLGPIAIEPCPERFAAGRSLLGATQKSWLKSRLRISDATWKIWGSTLMMQGLEYLRGMPFNLGQWDGFAAERQELMQYLLAERIDDVVVVSGDIHTFFAGQVTSSGSAGDPAGAVEFVGGSISSEGIPDTIADERYKELLGTFTDNVALLNPHMTFANTRARGYCVLTCGPRELVAEFRSPRTALAPASGMVTLARFRVARGSRRIERVA